MSDEINEALTEFNMLGEQICKKSLDMLILREGITMDDALSYFHLMQMMLNGYFSSPAFQNVVLNEKVKLHETIIPKLFDFMLYGIAEGEK